jgi:hypothetical protein
MVCVNQTWPHCVNQMGKTQSKPLAERHGNGKVCVNQPLISTGSKKKEPRYTCLKEVKASHSQRIWDEVSASVLHLVHNGLTAPFGKDMPRHNGEDKALYCLRLQIRG